MLGTDLLVGDRLYLSDHDTPDTAFDGDCHFFSTEGELVYIPFCDDFGPMNLADIMQFIDIVNQKLREYPGHKIVYRVSKAARKLSNAVFLMGSYMIVALNQTPDEAWSTFKKLGPQMEMFRDATFSAADFRLNLLDCWRGLDRAKSLGWLSEYDMEEYIHYDNPLEGDLHTVVPGKLISFRGPRTLPNVYADSNGCRVFSPRFYVDVFAEMGVTTVIRLNEDEYGAEEFEAHGIQCIDLEFEDCTNPPLHVIVEYLYHVDRAAGAVAVHCKAGLGRTGTLAAIYMMRSHGFSAREAIGWLRIVRPGSVIGGQQHFLCGLDPAAAAAAAAAVGGDATTTLIAAAVAAPGPAVVHDGSAADGQRRKGDHGVPADGPPDGGAAVAELDGPCRWPAAAAAAEAAVASAAEAAVAAAAGGVSKASRPQHEAAQVAAALISPQRTALKLQQALSRLE